MALYRWKRYNVNATKKWDTAKIATGKKSTLSIGVHACYAKNLTELGNMINVDDGKIQWNQEASFSSFGQSLDLSWYYAGNADSIRTHSSKTYDTTVYYAIITNKSVFLAATVTCDIYQISNVRWEYSRGSYIDTVVSSSQTAYPTDGKSGDYWYVYDTVAGTITAAASTGIASALVKNTTRGLGPAASVDAFDGDALQFTAEAQGGYRVIGWWNGGTKVSSEKTYQATGTGGAFTLTAKAEEYEAKLYVKLNGAYAAVQRVFKKTNGSYVEQADIPSLFPEGIKIRKAN